MPSSRIPRRSRLTSERRPSRGDVHRLRSPDHLAGVGSTSRARARTEAVPSGRLSVRTGEQRRPDGRRLSPVGILLATGCRRIGPHASAYRAQVMRSAGPNVRFIGAIWDQALLDQLYGHCASYLHGHSVGGDEPVAPSGDGRGRADRRLRRRASTARPRGTPRDTSGRRPMSPSAIKDDERDASAPPLAAIGSSPCRPRLRLGRRRASLRGAV